MFYDISAGFGPRQQHKRPQNKEIAYIPFYRARMHKQTLDNFGCDRQKIEPIFSLFVRSS